MKARDFIELLQSKLTDFSLQEKNEIIFYYDDLISSAMEEGLSEEEAVDKLGDIYSITTKLKEEYQVNDNQTKIDLNFPTKLFKRELNIDSRYNNINVSNNVGKVIIESYSESEIKVTNYNSLRNKVKITQNKDNLNISKSSRNTLTFLGIELLLIAIFVVVVGFIFDFNYNINTIFLTFIGVAISTSILPLYDLFTRNNSLYIYLPKNKYYNLNSTSRNSSYCIKNLKLNSLYGETKNGNYKIINTSSHIMNLKSNTGSIKVFCELLEEKLLIKEAKFMTYNGSIKLSNMEFNNVLSKSKNGQFKLVNTNITKDLTPSSYNGSIKLISAKINKTNIKTHNGSILLKEVELNLDSSYATNNGSIKLIESKTKDAILKGDNGTIKIINSETHNINSRTNNGSIKLKKVNCMDCVCETDNGSMKFKRSNVTDLNLKSHNGSITFNDGLFNNVFANANNGSISLINIRRSRMLYKLNLQSLSNYCKVVEIPNKKIVNEEDILKQFVVEAKTENGRIIASFLS